IPDPPQRWWPEHGLHPGRRRRADHAGPLPKGLAPQRSETTDTGPAAYECELQQHNAGGGSRRPFLNPHSLGSSPSGGTVSVQLEAVSATRVSEPASVSRVVT